MAHVSQDRKKGFQEKIKVINKKYGMKATLSVRDHMTIVLTIRSGAIDFVNDLQENNRERYDTTVYECNKKSIENSDFSLYSFSRVEDTFKGIACDYLTECFAVLLEGHYNNSDSQRDYFDVAWYIDVNIGADYTTPYELILKSPVIEVITESPVVEEQQINIEIPVQEVITTQKQNIDSLKKAISRFNKSNKSDKIKVVCDTKITDRKCYLYELKITYTNRIGNISTFTIVNDKGTYYIPVHTNNMYEQKFIELFNSKNNDDDDTLDLPFDIEVIETPLLPFDDAEKIEVVTALEENEKIEEQRIYNIKITHASDKVTITRWVGNNGQSFIFTPKKNKMNYIKEILNFDFNSMTKEYFYLMLDKIKKLCLRKYDLFDCEYSFDEIVHE